LLALFYSEGKKLLPLKC